MTQKSFPSGSFIHVLPANSSCIEHRPVENDEGIRLRREPQAREASDLVVVVRADLEAVERRRPEPGEGGRMLTVDDQLLESRHVFTLAHAA